VISGPTLTFHDLDCNKLTDEMLATFTRVNAVDTTKSLDLSLCQQIRGHGLEPLRGSRILQRVNIQTGNDSDTGIMDILEASLPFQYISSQVSKLATPSC